MRRLATRTGQAVSAVAAVLTSGCSFLGLEQLPYLACDDTSDCEVLNAGVDPSHCERWICVQPYCRRRRAVEPDEICDGHDQDCDGVIDEEGAARPPSQLARLAEGSELTSIASGQDRDAVAVGDGRAADPSFDLLTIAAGRWTPASPSLSASDAADPCALGCVVHDVVAAHMSDLVLVAALAGPNRSSARLRLGTFDPVADAGRVVLDPRSEPPDGIAAVSGGSLGAPSLTVMPPRSGRTPQALVAFVADGADDVVEAVGLWLTTEGLARPVVATASQRLAARPDTAAAPAPVAILPSGAAATANYVLAYRATDGLAIVVIEALGEPASGASLAIREERLLEGASPTGEVVIAADAEAARILVAYVERDEIVLLAGTMGESLTWSAATARLSAPGATELALVHVQTGLAVPSSGVSGGGYLLAFRDAERTFVARVPDGLPDAPATISVVGEASARPTGWQTDGHVSLLAGVDGALTELPFACGPRRSP